MGAACSTARDCPAGQMCTDGHATAQYRCRNFEDGRKMKCRNDPVPGRIYRYTAGQRRLYPTTPIGVSWDATFSSTTTFTLDCTTFGEGAPMDFKCLAQGCVTEQMCATQPGSVVGSAMSCQAISEGSAVKCLNDLFSNSVYRYTTVQDSVTGAQQGVIRQYPSADIALTWDSSYGQTTPPTIDCLKVLQDWPMGKRCASKRDDCGVNAYCDTSAVEPECRTEGNTIGSLTAPKLTTCRGTTCPTNGGSFTQLVAAPQRATGVSQWAVPSTQCAVIGLSLVVLVGYVLGVWVVPRLTVLTGKCSKKGEKQHEESADARTQGGGEGVAEETTGLLGESEKKQTKNTYNSTV